MDGFACKQAPRPVDSVGRVSDLCSDGHGVDPRTGPLLGLLRAVILGRKVRRVKVACVCFLGAKGYNQKQKLARARKVRVWVEPSTTD